MGGQHYKINNMAEREASDKAFFSMLHPARVTDINLEAGTVDVSFLDARYKPTDLAIPVMGLSVPPKQNQDDQNYLSSSWGRYIPQKGDVVTVGFSSKGDPYIIGYTAFFYRVFKEYDDGREDKGGIGWSEAAGKKLKPGYWDFKSSESCFLYLGKRAKISSGPHKLILDQETSNMTLSSTQIKEEYGEASEIRRGNATRKILPTDSSETNIATATGTAQESTDAVKIGSLLDTDGIEMARTSMGNVVDETTKTFMVPSRTLSSLPGTEVRMLESVKDPTGSTDLYVYMVDNLGNFGFKTASALFCQWEIPTATYKMSNNITDWTSTTSFSVSSPLITLSADVQAVIDSLVVSLGSSSASHPVAEEMI